MTGMRSWTGEVIAFGVVVRCEHVLTQVPAGTFHLSHNPAKSNSFPSSTSKQNGCFALPYRFHS